MKNVMTIMILLFTLTSCGGGMFTKDAEPKEDGSYSTPWGNVTITTDAFIFGSDYPADIVIPDIDGMRDTAFVVSFLNPSGVIAIDLDSNPLRISTRFAVFIAPAGTGMPSALHILSTTRAFLLTSSHVIDFNPTTGGINTTVDLTTEIMLSSAYPISEPFDVDGDGDLDTEVTSVDMNYPASLTTVNGKLFITMSNLINPIMPAVAAPGIVRVFELSERSPYLDESDNYIITTDYNPTGITLLPDGMIAVTNSGVSQLSGGAAHPATNSSIDIVDTDTLEVVGNVSIGYASLSFKDLAVTTDGDRAYIGSASFGEVYSINPENYTAFYTRSNPITITGNSDGSDYLSAVALSYDNWYLFVASFDNSAIYPVDVSETVPDVLPNIFPEAFTIGFPKGVTEENPTGTNTGIGDIAVRPGIPGTDFQGADLFAITGNPGTLVAINTHGTGEAAVNQISNMTITPEGLETIEDENAVQLLLDIEFADGSTEEGLQGTFTNPLSGFPSRISWKSNDRDVATMSSSGLLTPVANGTTTISASIGQTSATKEITVNLPIISESEPPPSEEEEEEETEENEEDDGPIIYLSPEILEWLRGLSFVELSQQTVIQLNPAVLEFLLGQNEETETEEELEILTEAPEGTDSFADRVVSYEIGASGGYNEDYLPGIVLGAPGGSTDILSLGMRGEIVLEMTDFIIADGEGPDFTVFENPFLINNDPRRPFSEPGIVSVSNNGIDFYEFGCNLASAPLYPGCAGTVPTYALPGSGISPTDPSVSGGNQFDLAEVGLETARFVKIKDSGIAPSVYGPTNRGFDLDAVGVVNGVLSD